MKILWSVQSLMDRDEIFDSIRAENVPAAIRTDDRIQDTVSMLAHMPLLGRAGRVPGTREIFVKGLPYFAVYVAGADAVVVQRVLHGARQWPPARRAWRS